MMSVTDVVNTKPCIVWVTRNFVAGVISRVVIFRRIGTLSVCRNTINRR